MFVDASAIVAVLVGEREGPDFVARLDQAGVIYTSPIAIYEAALGIARILNVSVAAAQSEVDIFVAETGAQVVSITGDIGRGALSDMAEGAIRRGSIWAIALPMPAPVRSMCRYCSKATISLRPTSRSPERIIHPRAYPAALLPAMRPKTAPAMSPVPLA